MMRSMYSAISGLKAQQTMLDVTANNLANVNTIGFKASATSFQDALSQTQRGAAAANAGGFAGQAAAQVGLGVQIGAITNRMTGGGLQTTGNPLDIAISGEGWMRVALAPGAPNPANPTAGTPAVAAMNYTRAGNFIRNNEGFLTTQDGYYVIGRSGTGAGAVDCYINIPTGATDISIGADGSVSFVPPAGWAPGPGMPPIGADGRAIAGYVSLATFPNEQALAHASGNRFIANAASGAEVVGTPSSVGYGTAVGGAIEMSNVDLATEFTNMIVAQRGFQANSRVISTGDEMLQDLVNLKR
ncbi:MAG: flagellar hook-basal body complex protein [Solirubrobacteraceae bacterium]|jgi:fagellar hook-basal body proteins|nr:flagellar hook-basal body complex protein [Solirubrobacteraceae bacterium]